MTMSIGHECTTGGSQQRQLVKTDLSLSLLPLHLYKCSWQFIFIYDQ